jgi:cation diffusion facilitator family transporter
MIAEIVGGWISGSLAIVTDAAHLLSDIAGFLISLFALTWSTKPANTNMSFGYHRAEILGALLSIAMVWALTAYLVFEAIERIKYPQPINAKVMLVVAVVGLVVNIIIIIALTLHDNHHHEHENQHDLESTPVAPSSNPHRHSNLNIRAALIHAIGDIIQSAGVLIAAVVIWYRPDWSIADPLCTFLFSILVFASTVMVTREAIHILMEGAPKDINLAQLESDIRALAGVKGIHDLHVWSLAAGKPALTIHVLRHEEHDVDLVLMSCQSLLCTRYNIHHATIQVESRIDPRYHCHSHLPVAVSGDDEEWKHTRLPW